MFSELMRKTMVFIIKMKYGVATPSPPTVRPGREQASEPSHANRMVFPGRRRGYSCSKNRRLRKLHPSSIKQSERGPASNTLHFFRKRNRNRVALWNRKHCTDCEHDLTSPIVNSTRRGSVPGRDQTRPSSLFSDVALCIVCYPNSLRQ